jgi:acyl-CoA synthetase (AMP-forming)/AMP-acid ligase II
VMLSHANVVVSALAMLSEGISMPGGVYLHAAPMFHIADFGVSLPQHLVGNAHAFLPVWSPAAMLECVARARVTDVVLVPTMLQMLIDQVEIAGAGQLHSLERLVYGASTISEAAILRAMIALPNVEFFQGYGMTELAPLGTLNGAWYHSVEGRKAGKLRAAGRASLCTEIRIADEQGRELPRGEVGEVLVRGPNVMLGYWNDPKQTDAALRDGWMHTGDCARMDAEGFIYVVDRIKDMIKSGGENVFSAEVENVLAQHPAVSACAVIGVPNEKWGESVHAVVVTKPDSSISGLQLIEHCRRHIAGYKCPRSIEFRQSLPLSGAGKVLKTVLRKPFWEGRDRQVA